MLFNSVGFFIFLPIVYILYWLIPRNQLVVKNTLLLISSYFFYSCWDVRFLGLLLFSTLLDYYCGIQVSESITVSKRKLWLWISIAINLGFLGFFKYYNFFITSFVEALQNIGFKVENVWVLNIVLPVGISFYTFHGLSYVIDIYNKKISPERNIIEYSLFVSFFPLLVAGPIERATHLLPQLKKNRFFDYAKTTDGLKQILWGLFKKIVIADNCAVYANTIFENSENFSSSSLLLGSIFFSFQIYCDFSGYSDIALGTARLFGIELLNNFSFPYFSRDIAEFWRRWHISLSSWFKDYLYIPLGGSKVSKSKVIINTFIIFLVSGFWHGANWTFVFWGFLNAIYFLPLLVLNLNRRNLETVASNKLFPSVGDFFRMLFTFTLVTFAWIFFRSADIKSALVFLDGLFRPSIFTVPENLPVKTIVFLILFICIEWISRFNTHPFQLISNIKHLSVRWLICYFIIFLILFFSGKQQEFIYFQF
jgi:alginate O-acetyltransferase complex protein AlgI